MGVADRVGSEWIQWPNSRKRFFREEFRLVRSPIRSPLRVS
jgi:hypothetical protein